MKDSTNTFKDELDRLYREGFIHKEDYLEQLRELIEELNENDAEEVKSIQDSIKKETESNKTVILEYHSLIVQSLKKDPNNLIFGVNVC